MEYWEWLYYYTKTSSAQLLHQNTWLKNSQIVLYGTLSLITKQNIKVADMIQQLSWILQLNVAFVLKL